MHLQNKDGKAKVQNMGVSKTSENIQIIIKMPNLNQEPPASFKAPNEDLKGMDDFCNFKIKREPNFGTLVYKRAVTISK